MSFWLNQVNKVLNQLDDHVETVAEEAPDVVTTAASRARRILGKTSITNASSQSDDGDNEDDDVDYFDDNDEGPYSDEEESGEELYSTDNLSNENAESTADDEQVAAGFEMEHQDDEMQGDDRDNGSRLSEKITENTNEGLLEANNHASAPATTTVIPDDGLVLQPEEAISVSEEGRLLHPAEQTTFAENSIVDSASSSPVMVEKTTISPDLVEKATIIASPKERQPDSSQNSDPAFPPAQLSPVPISSNASSNPLKNLTPPPNSTGSVSGRQQGERNKKLKEANVKLKNALTATQNDYAKLQKLSFNLEKQLNAARIEMEAQMKELDQAAITMSQERDNFKLKREEILGEHAEEFQKLKEEYERKLAEQREQYEQVIMDMQGQFAREQETRHLEQGENTAELENALIREKDALQKIISLHSEKSSLESDVTKMELQLDLLQKQVFVLTETSQSASKAQEEAEAKLDASLDAHKRQMQLRQTREAELERTVTELGAALTMAQLEAVNAAKASSNSDNMTRSRAADAATTSYKEHYEVTQEELESVKIQLSMSTSQCETLQKELQEITKERVKEAAATQNQIHEYEEKLQKLTLANNRLEATVRELNINPIDEGADTEAMRTSSTATASDSRIRNLTHDLEQARRKITSLSDQLIRQQGISEQFKSELLAVKGRLQAATARAEAAEQHQQSLLASGGEGDDNTFELETGGYSLGARNRRRVKGGNNRFNQLPTRSIRNAVGLRQTTYPGMQQQIAQTIDAIDVWMLEAGGILRHEPLARLGFGLYCVVLHAWCFALVAFHTVEAEMHDLKQIPLHAPVLYAGH